MLAAQAETLDTIFHSTAQRAALNIVQYPKSANRSTTGCWTRPRAWAGEPPSHRTDYRSAVLSRRCTRMTDEAGGRNPSLASVGTVHRPDYCGWHS
jgi:hypothetical protein